MVRCWRWATPLVAVGLAAVLQLYFRSAAAAPSKPAAAPVKPTTTQHSVDFHREVLPILSRHCARCHTGGKLEGKLSIASRESLLAGGESGPAVVVGHSGKSLLVELVSGGDPDRVMPAEGRRLTAEEIGVLKTWIDNGLTWEPGLALSAFPTARWEPRRVELPAASGRDGDGGNPIDRLLAPYFTRHAILSGQSISDRLYARRVFLDLVGLLPSPQDIATLEADPLPDKRRQLVRRLLESRDQYAVHWLSFWNDALRNDYHGPGYIDGGREQITRWLYRSLSENKPYDQFVRELISPSPESAGFVKGIVWRGVVNASQRPEMQAAQNVSQVFLGINLKCASCHDSFVSQWKLDDSYGLASVFAGAPLEVHRCDAPMGRFVQPRFLYAKLGAVDAKAPLAERRRQLAKIITSRDDGRLARTIVNRLWARLLGRGLVEPVDSMDKAPWQADVLDYLATDLADHGFDLQRTLELIATSRAYQLPSVGATPAREEDFVFRGPLVKRLSAEQFIDAVSTVTGVWQETSPRMKQKTRGGGGGGQLAAVGSKAQNRSRSGRGQGEGQTPHVEGQSPRNDRPSPSPSLTGRGVSASPDFAAVGIRAALADADPLSRALGRPNREQVVTNRDSAATTLQLLELTNGTTLDRLLKRGADNWLKDAPGSSDQLIEALFLRVLARRPGSSELSTARELVGSPATKEGVQDLIWTLVMLPEFQLIE